MPKLSKQRGVGLAFRLRTMGDRVLDHQWSFAEQAHSHPTSPEARAALLANPGFGRVFTDHMVTVQWTEGHGWHDAVLGERKPFMLDPATLVLHYAQEIFEGMKAYRTSNGGVVLFRPEENARRFNKSAERMGMATIPEELFVGAVEALVRADADWVPSGEGSLYLRPFAFATDVFLGVKPSSSYTFCVIASPVGGYFKPGVSALTIWVADGYTRAAVGGTGFAKCGGNYAGGLAAQAQASANDCDQVVFLDAAEHRWIEELGGMNLFFVMADGTLRTPPLSGTILPGVTRASVIQLARDAGHTVNEAPYSFEEWKSDAESGRMREAFACGTAAVIAAIGKVRHGGGEFLIADGKPGQLTEQLLSKLTGIQRGQVNDEHGWVHRVV